MLGKYCFSECKSLSTVTFESGSQLSSIAESAFWYCSSLSSIFIPSSVEMLGKYCFQGCDSLSTVTFESGSQLSSIAEYAFRSCSSLSSFCIPPCLQELGKGAIDVRNLREISVAAGNRHFRVSGSFLLDFECISMKRYFGSESAVRIENTIERVAIGCFLDCQTISKVIFESDSQLSSLGESAFWLCSSLSSICCPSSLQIILARFQALLKLPAAGLPEGDRVFGGADSVEDETVNRGKNK
jgi:hypothetical protein